MNRLGQLQTVESWERVEGSPTLVGATWLESEQSWNFALFSRHATGVTLLLYDGKDSIGPIRQIRLDPIRNKTGRIWHCFVPQSSAPQARFYAYRVEGLWDPSQGHRFDPFATDIFFPPKFSREAAKQPGANDGRAPLGVLPREAVAARQRGPTTNRAAFDREDAPPPRHTHDAIVYELHVKGFTARANSGVAGENRGTFPGLIEKIPYLKELGVTVVELLPVHQFDPQEGNYWGSTTLSFFAAHRGYAVRDAVAEFREMVKAFHAAGIEVWLDVVYNHTCEGGDNGPTYSCRGMDNRSYYLLDETGQYRNDSGCGNVLHCAHPSVRVLVLRRLRHWAQSMGVDGYRFDLASVFARNEDGSVNLDSPPLIAEISALAALLDVRVVAEAWDIGAYFVGEKFPRPDMAAVEWTVPRRRAVVRCERAGRFRAGVAELGVLFERCALRRGRSLRDDQRLLGTGPFPDSARRSRRLEAHRGHQPVKSAGHR
jgi:glycogen operon protein